MNREEGNLSNFSCKKRYQKLLRGKLLIFHFFGLREAFNDYLTSFG